MYFGHEKLDAYKETRLFFRWLWKRIGVERCPADSKSQIQRAALSILNNMSEGNSLPTSKARRRHFEIARASAAECAAVLDAFEIFEVLTEDECKEAKDQLLRITSMLTGLGGRGYRER